MTIRLNEYHIMRCGNRCISIKIKLREKNIIIEHKKETKKNSVQFMIIKHGIW